MSGFLREDMRRDVQDIFRLTPHEKQCMMFSATLSKEIRPVCRKFMQDVSLEGGRGLLTPATAKSSSSAFGFTIDSIEAVNPQTVSREHVEIPLSFAHLWLSVLQVAMNGGEE